MPLREFVNWDQTQLTHWTDMRRFFVQWQGNYENIARWNNDGREVATLWRLWTDIRIGQSRREASRGERRKDGTHHNDTVSVNESDRSSSCYIGELLLLLSGYVFLPRSELRHVVNVTATEWRENTGIMAGNTLPGAG
ncbi:unnamed protein product, partial [Amoebophrya sp. A25]|eukprot:GSA25T00010947001.1